MAREFCSSAERLSGSLWSCSLMSFDPNRKLASVEKSVHREVSNGEAAKERLAEALEVPKAVAREVHCQTWAVGSER